MAPTDRHPSLSDPKAVAEAGEKIYNDKHRQRLESEHMGQFAVIDVLSEEVYIADSPEGALLGARNAAPRGIFHLIKIGSSGAFRVSHSSNVRPDWLFR